MLIMYPTDVSGRLSAAEHPRKGFISAADIFSSRPAQARHAAAHSSATGSLRTRTRSTRWSLMTMTLMVRSP